MCVLGKVLSRRGNTKHGLAPRLFTRTMHTPPRHPSKRHIGESQPRSNPAASCAFMLDAGRRWRNMPDYGLGWPVVLASRCSYSVVVAADSEPASGAHGMPPVDNCRENCGKCDVEKSVCACCRAKSSTLATLPGLPLSPSTAAAAATDETKMWPPSCNMNKRRIAR